MVNADALPAIGTIRLRIARAEHDSGGLARSRTLNNSLSHLTSISESVDDCNQKTKAKADDQEPSGELFVALSMRVIIIWLRSLSGKGVIRHCDVTPWFRQYGVPHPGTCPFASPHSIQTCGMSLVGSVIFPPIACAEKIQTTACSLTDEVLQSMSGLRKLIVIER